MKKKVKVAALALGLATALNAGAITAPDISVDAETIFSISETSASSLLISNDHKCGEGKCGEHECGEHECGEHKCGEGKCGE
jgi:uncharacterized low-complexity protein